jgi:hypothetical protein
MEGEGRKRRLVRQLTKVVEMRMKRIYAVFVVEWMTMIFENSFYEVVI